MQIRSYILPKIFLTSEYFYSLNDSEKDVSKKREGDPLHGYNAGGLWISKIRKMDHEVLCSDFGEEFSYAKSERRQRKITRKVLRQ